MSWPSGGTHQTLFGHVGLARVPRIRHSRVSALPLLKICNVPQQRSQLQTSKQKVVGGSIDCKLDVEVENAHVRQTLSSCSGDLRKSSSLVLGDRVRPTPTTLVLCKTEPSETSSGLCFCMKWTDEALPALSCVAPEDIVLVQQPQQERGPGSRQSDQKHRLLQLHLHGEKHTGDLLG